MEFPLRNFASTCTLGGWAFFTAKAAKDRKDEALTMKLTSKPVLYFDWSRSRSSSFR